MKRLATLLFVSAAAAAGASADEIVLSKPIAGATLHDGGVDMSVYWTLTDGSGYEVTAIYTAHDGPYQPGRLAMLLEDGDAVTFGLPAFDGVLYSFSRSGTAVTVRADQNTTTLAQR